MSGLDELEQAERREWSDEHSKMTLLRVAPRVGIIRAEGRGGEGAALFWQEHFEWLLCDDALLFFDGAKLGFVGSQFISIGSSLVIAARPKMAEFNVMVANVMIEMVAKTVNMSLGGFMTIYRKQEDFDAALVRALELQARPT